MLLKLRNISKKVEFFDFKNTFTWEKRKLGDVSDIQGGGTPDSKNQAYWSGDINWFTPTEVFNQGYLSESRRKITKEGLLKSSATLMPPGTV
ncbi:restriction endonuclease subunit S, partial [Oenococcus oeni]